MSPLEPHGEPGAGVDAGLGAWLRDERQARQLTLEELAQTTRIPIRSLQLLEEGRLEELPGEVFVRGFLRSYARAVGLSPAAVLARHDRARAGSVPPPTPRLAPAPADRGSGFGIAIALVILLVLFTLALSIVLRPRRRDVPVELSQAPTAPAGPLGQPPSPELPPWLAAPSDHPPSCSAPSTTATPTAS